MTAAQQMLEQGDEELTGQFPTVFTWTPTEGGATVQFRALIEDPQSADPVEDGVGLRYGEEQSVAIVARQSLFPNRLPKAGEYLKRGTRTFQIDAVRASENGHLVGFICPQPTP